MLSNTKNFIWSISSISPFQEQLVCHGYTSSNYNSYIISDVIDLFTQFYSTNSFSIDEIKRPKDADDTRKRLFSLTFNDGLLRLNFEPWPNGTNKKSKGKLKFFLVFVLQNFNTTQISIKSLKCLPSD